MSDKKEIIREVRQVAYDYGCYQEVMADLRSAADVFQQDCEAMESEAKNHLSYFEAKQLNKLPHPPQMKIPFAIPPQRPALPAVSVPLRSILFAALSGLLSILSVVFWILTVIIAPLGDALGVWNILVSVVMLGSLAVWFFYGAGEAETLLEWIDEEKEWKKKFAEWEKSYNALPSPPKLSVDAMIAYEAAFASFVSDCREEAKRTYEQMAESFKAAKEKRMAELQKSQERLLELAQKLDRERIISPSQYFLANQIATALEGHRASTLEDAINIAIEDERKRQEELRRQEEARRQEQLLREQAENQRFHQRRMEEAAQEQARAEGRRAAAAERQARAAERQAQQMWQDAAAKCRSCKRVGCPASAKAHSLSCSAFVPR